MKIYTNNILSYITRNLLIVVFLLAISNQAIAQCAFGGTLYTTTDLNAIAYNTWTGASDYYGGEYMQVNNAKAGDLLLMSSCASGATGYDNQLTFFNPANTAVAYNDDNGPFCVGSKASISYLVPSGGAGNYRLLNNVYNCATNFVNGDVYIMKYPISIGVESNPLFTAASGCSNGTFSVGAGAYYDVTVAANTWYNWTFNNNGAANINSFYLQPLNGNAAAASQTNLTGWFSGTTTSVRIHGWRTSSTWSGTSGIMTYRNTEPTLGSISATSVDFCESGGTFTPAFTGNSTANGTVQWDYGWNSGSGGDLGSGWQTWVTGTSSGTCCFPKKTSNSDTNADRTRYRVVNNGCISGPSSTALIRNRWNEDPSSLSISSTSYCSNAVPANITLTANFPTNVNMNGTVEFFSGSCGGTLVATSSPGATSSTVTATIPAPSSTTTYFARYNPGTGTSCSAGACVSNTVTVNAIPAITSATAAASPICANATTTLTANGVAGEGATVTWWTGSGGSGSNLGTGTTLTAGPGTYYARVTGTCTPAVEASVTVGSTAIPAISSVTADANPVCANATTTLTANGVAGAGATVTWWTGSGGSGSNLGTGSTLTAGPGTYYARVTGTCAPAVEASVTVGSDPTSAVGAVSADQTICSGSQPADMTIASATGTVQWQIADDAAFTTNVTNVGTNSTTLTAVQVGTLSATRYFRATVTSGACAAINSDVITVTVDASPSAPTAGNAVGCQSYTIPNITASVGGGETVDWYANASGGLPLATGSISFATAQTAPATYTYYAEAQNTTTGCLSATRTAVTLTINPKANIAAGPDLQTCVSTPVSVPGGNASASNFGSFYVWSVGVGVGSISNEGALTPIFTPDPSDAGTTVTLDFTTDDPDGAGPCPTETDAMNIFVDALPTTADAGSDIFDCLEDLVVNLAGNTPSVGTGAWSGSATFAQGTTPNSTAEVGAVGTYTFTWTINNGVCPPSSDNVNVSYNNPLPITMTNGATGSCVVNDFADHHIFDANNNIIASINSNGQNLGSVSVTVNILGSPSEVANNIVQGVCGNSFTAFMGRNFDIVPDNQPSTRVDVKLYFTDSEFTALQAKAIANNNGDLCDEDDDVAFISKVHVTKYPTGNGPGGPDGTYIENSGDGQDFGANYIQVGVSSFSSFYLHGSKSIAPLPVELINFTATAINNEYIHLDWATALEINNDGFELQRSTDAQNWTNIAWINGNDNSTTAKFYSHNDMQVAQNITHYYRLKQIDNDGQFEYSNIVNATLTGSNSSFNVLEFVPNPTVDMTTLLISSGVSQDIKVVIYNSIGQEVQTGNHTLNIGMNQIKFDVNLLSAGTYMATVTSGNEIRTKRLVIGR